MAKKPRAFVIGWPIAHSLSPALHSFWLNQYGIEGSYEKIAVEPEKLSNFLETFKDNGFVGGNITIPHKQAVFQKLDQADASAKKLQAVNTLWIEGDRLKAGNTDGYGFTANLDEFCPQWRKAKTALVIGAGGASVAIVYALIDAGIDNIIVANRTLLRAEKLTQDVGEKSESIAFENIDTCLHRVDLVVNTTSLGMKGNPPLDVDLAQLPKNAIVTDIVYNPLQTPLLQNASKQGLKTVDGIGMLLHQAVPGFEKWFGVRPEVTRELRAYMLEKLEASQ